MLCGVPTPFVPLISNCPFVSKALDSYVAQLYSPIWMKNQAETQFQGRGSNHELAALLLTETVQYSQFIIPSKDSILAPLLSILLSQVGLIKAER